MWLKNTECKIGQLERMRAESNRKGIPVVIDAIAKCEEAGLCCGQLVHTLI